MATESPDKYLKRKQVILESPPASFETDELAYHSRPHRTLPELVEIYPDVWIPPEPSSSSSSSSEPSGILVWNSGMKWNSGAKWK